MRLAAIFVLLAGCAFGQSTRVLDETSKLAPKLAIGAGFSNENIYSPLASSELPDAPVPQEVHHADGFFKFRTWDQPVIHPNKKSWALFALTHAAAWGALAAANHNKEPLGEESVALGAVTGFDFLALKLFSPAMSIEAPIYAAIHYGRAR